MACSTTSKLLLTSTADLLSSPTFFLSRRRSTTVSASRNPRISPNPPDLVDWVTREGGFVHPKLRIAEGISEGRTIIASEEVPKGSRLVALPERLALRIRMEDSSLNQFVRRVPGDSVDLYLFFECFVNILLIPGLHCDSVTHNIKFTGTWLIN